MSDVPETPDGAAEAAQGAVEPQAEVTPTERPAMPDGWTGEFDPHRAKATIDRLRPFETRANMLERLEGDPDAAAAWIAETHGFQLEEDAPGYTDATEDDGPLTAYEQRLAAIEASEQQRRTAERDQAVAAHVVELTADANLTDEEKRTLFALANEGQPDEQRTERLVKQYVDAAEKRAEARYEEYLESKRAPAPPQEGKAGEPQIDPWDAEARIARMAARMTAEGS